MVVDVRGKVFLITGAATGIGAAMVGSFLEAGAKHIAILDIAENDGRAFEKQIHSKYGVKTAKFFKCDVTKDDELNRAFDETIKEHGYIDVVVNNAGLMNDNEKVYRKEVQVNVTALATSTFKALKLMRKDEGGRGGTIINISSAAALIQYSMMPLYNGTKSAVLQFSNCLALDECYRNHGVRVIAICFGATNTALLSNEKMGSYDKKLEDMLFNDTLMDDFYVQTAEVAANGVVEAFRLSPAGGTWLVANDEVHDITEDVKEAYGILGRKFIESQQAKLAQRAA